MILNFIASWKAEKSADIIITSCHDDPTSAVIHKPTLPPPY